MLCFTFASRLAYQRPNVQSLPKIAYCFQVIGRGELEGLSSAALLFSSSPSALCLLSEERMFGVFFIYLFWWKSIKGGKNEISQKGSNIKSPLDHLTGRLWRQQDCDATPGS